jgi:hypothetical protein
MADGTLTRGTIVAAIQLGAPTAGLEETLRHDGDSKSKRWRKSA